MSLRRLGLAAFLLVAFAISVSPAFGAGNGGGRIVSEIGVAQIGGQTVMVEVVVSVPEGQDVGAATRGALERQGARPFGSAELGSTGFSATGLVWSSFPVDQSYNAGSSNTDDEPAYLGGSGDDVLISTQGTWSAVGSSNAALADGGITDRCPSLVKQCKGRQLYDTENDVAWLDLGGPDRRTGSITLGVTWFGTSNSTGPEADMAMTTNPAVSWDPAVEGSIDLETVVLHENGHVLGLGHSGTVGAVMEAFYGGPRLGLHQDDAEGITYLYDNSITGSITGTVNDDTGAAIAGATVSLDGTSLSGTTDGNGLYTISGVPDPVTYDVTASAPDHDSSTTLRVTVDGSVGGVNFSLSPSQGGDDGGGGGPPKCRPKKFC